MVLDKQLQVTLLEKRGYTRIPPEVPANLSYWFCNCVSWLKGSSASPVPRCQELDSSWFFSSFATTGPVNIVFSHVTTTMTTPVLLHSIRCADVPCLAVPCQLTGLLSPFNVPTGSQKLNEMKTVAQPQPAPIILCFILTEPKKLMAITKGGTGTTFSLFSMMRGRDIIFPKDKLDMHYADAMLKLPSFLVLEVQDVIRVFNLQV